MTTLAATVRNDTGKSVARKMRAAGQLPAVMYGKDIDTTMLSIDPKDLLGIFKKTQDRNTIVNLEVGGETIPCLVREVQRHPVSRELRHVDFYRLRKEDPVEVMVPIETEGRPKGTVLGGRLRVIRREVQVRCTYDSIPRAFVLDVAPLEIGDMIMASEIETPDGVELVFDHDFNVVTLLGKLKPVKKKKVEATPGLEGEEGEEPPPPVPE